MSKLKFLADPKVMVPILFVFAVATGMLRELGTALVGQFSTLIPLGFKVLFVGGLLVALVGLGVRITHKDWKDHANHWMQWGATGAGVGLIGLVGGLDVAITVVGSVLDQVSANFHWHATPALNNLLNATPPPTQAPSVVAAARQ